jgi:hypothetical protein
MAKNGNDGLCCDNHADARKALPRARGLRGETMNMKVRNIICWLGTLISAYMVVVVLGCIPVELIGLRSLARVYNRLSLLSMVFVGPVAVFLGIPALVMRLRSNEKGKARVLVVIVNILGILLSLLGIVVAVCYVNFCRTLFPSPS